MIVNLGFVYILLLKFVFYLIYNEIVFNDDKKVWVIYVLYYDIIDYF